MSESAAVITWPEGTAALDLKALVTQTAVPVFVEVGGKRFRLTDWNEQALMFTAVGPLGPTE